MNVSVEKYSIRKMVGFSESHPIAPIVNASTGAGYVTNIGGLNSYVTGSNLSHFVILMVTDIYGIEAPVFRMVADKVAATGDYYVVAPDFYNNDSFDPNDVNRPLSVWLEDHDPRKGSEAAKPVIEALRSQGYSVGIAGFCWGGLTVSDIAKTKFVKASAQLHPSFAQVEDYRGIKSPIAILGGENDTMTPPELIRQIERYLKQAKPKVHYLVKLFPKAEHGWTLLYDPNDPKAAKLADKAHQTMIKWFDKHLKH